MPTVIDSLIVKLGLDAGDLTSKTPDVARKLKLVDDASKKNTDGLKKVTAASKETGTGFASLALSAGKFLAVLGGTVAIKNFIVDSVTANTALERMSQNLNIGVTSLSAWGSAARGLGGSAQGILSTFQMLSAARYQLFHGTGEMPAVGRYFTQIGLAPGELNAPHEQQMLDIQKYSLNRFGAGGKYTDSQRETAYQAGLAGGLSPDMMNLILMPGQQLKDYLKTMKGLAPSDKQAMEQTQLLKSMVMIGLDYRKLGYDLIELLNPVAEAANRFLVWVNKQTPAERDTILGGAGILGTLGAWLAGSWFAKKIGKAVGAGIGGGAATEAGDQVVERAAAKTVAENAAEIAAANAAEAGGVGAVVAGAGAAEVGTGGLATPIIIGAVIAVLAGLGIWWLIDKVKKDGWSGSGDSAAWQETKDFWSSVGSGIATAAKAVGRGTEAAGKWIARTTSDAGSAIASDAKVIAAKARAQAERVSKMTGISADLIYAQWEHETGGFKNRGARNLNNLAGINASGGGGQDYRNFSSLDSFGDYYAHLMRPGGRYSGISNARTAGEFAEILKRGGYYSAPEGMQPGWRGRCAASLARPQTQTLVLLRLHHRTLTRV
jgi:hypothetical protein